MWQNAILSDTISHVTGGGGGVVGCTTFSSLGLQKHDMNPHCFFLLKHTTHDGSWHGWYTTTNIAHEKNLPNHLIKLVMLQHSLKKEYGYRKFETSQIKRLHWTLDTDINHYELYWSLWFLGHWTNLHAFCNRRNKEHAIEALFRTRTNVARWSEDQNVLIYRYRHRNTLYRLWRIPEATSYCVTTWLLGHWIQNHVFNTRPILLHRVAEETKNMIIGLIPDTFVCLCFTRWSKDQMYWFAG